MEVKLMRMSRESYADADRRSKEIETSLAHFKAEWDRAKGLVDEELRRLNHDQASLRGVLMCILDEMDKADAAAAKPKAKGNLGDGG